MCIFGQVKLLEERVSGDEIGTIMTLVSYRVLQVSHRLDCTFLERFLPPSSHTQPKNDAFRLPLALL